MFNSDDISSGDSETLDDFVWLLIRSTIESLSRQGGPVKAGAVFDRAAPEGMTTGVILRLMVPDHGCDHANKGPRPVG